MPKGIAFAALAIGPAVAWQVVLLVWLGRTGLNEGQGLLQTPLSPLYYLYPLRPETVDVVQTIVVPGVVCLGAGLLLIWRNQAARRSAAVWAMVLNAVLFVPCLIFGLVLHPLLLVPSIHAVIAVHMKREDRKHRQTIEAIERHGAPPGWRR